LGTAVSATYSFAVVGIGVIVPISACCGMSGPILQHYKRAGSAVVITTALHGVVTITVILSAVDEVT
jgi:hypothetical protein